MLERIAALNHVVFYRSPLLHEAGVPHAFSTRVGGISPAPFDSLNLGNPSGVEQVDNADRIQENYCRLHLAIGCESRRRVFVHQVHGCQVEQADSPVFENARKADALISADPDKLLSVRTADCVPILLGSRDGRCVAAVHAGWRGIVTSVICQAIRQMQVAPENLVAAVGPCIGFDAYEVGDEVLQEFERVFGPDAPVRRESAGKGRVDLRQAARAQLLAEGLDPRRIDISDRCTFRDREEFFSHRRDRGITGRMAAVIGAVNH